MLEFLKPYIWLIFHPERKILSSCCRHEMEEGRTLKVKTRLHLSRLKVESLSGKCFLDKFA